MDEVAPYCEPCGQTEDSISNHDWQLQTIINRHVRATVIMAVIRNETGGILHLNEVDIQHLRCIVTYKQTKTQNSGFKGALGLGDMASNHYHNKLSSFTSITINDDIAAHVRGYKQT